MIGFALCHGWSFDARVMAAWRSMLLRHFPAAAMAMVDLGFTGAARTPALSPDRRWIAVGHSYGFAYLLQQPVPWHAAISINGFTRFCPHRNEAAGTPVRAINRMLEHLATDTHAVVEGFQARCGAPGAAPAVLDTPALQDHLIQVRDLDLAPPSCATLALATREDRVVSPALTAACFSPSWCQLRQFPGDHMRLLHAPAEGLPDVVRFIESLHD